MTQDLSSSSDEAVDGGFIIDDPDVKVRRTRKLPARRSRKRAVSYIESSDEDVKRATPPKLAEDSEDDDQEFLLREDGSENAPIALSDESPLSSVNDENDDIPLALREIEKPAKKPRKPRAKRQPKPKKAKVPYFTRVTNKLYEQHPDLKEVFPDMSIRKGIAVERSPQPDNMKVKLLPFQLEGLNWLIKQEESDFGGGVLADEMGMGKTIQTIALFMNDRSKSPNLVIAPTVALMQWRSEIETHTGGELKVGIYHGSNKMSKKEMLEYDVILTTYSVLESVFRKQQYGFRRKNGLVKEKSALHDMPFYRVILDEAHNIKDRQSGTAKAANMLNTQKRWCLSGTPLQNRIGEMYSLIRFMKLFPFCEYFCTKCPCRSTEWRFPDNSHCVQCNHSPMLHTNFFNHFMLKNIQKYGVETEMGQTSFDNIRILLRNVMLRRTKVERADDLGLPPRIVEIRKDVFNEEEKDLYASLYSDSQRKFNSFVAEGVVLNNYANIFTLITRMRQLADHPDLVLRRVGANSITDSEALSGILVCQLCDDESEDCIESKCHHKFCRLCITEYIDGFDGDESKLECPVCHIGLSIDLQQPAIEFDDRKGKKSSIINRINMGEEWRSSTKIEALAEELFKLRSDRQTIKSIVFSQFTSMLDLVEWRLKRAGFETVKLQGSMSPTQRENTIRYFMENSSVEVFLVSLKAGGVALNLCEASQVFILDPWWNPSVEWQSGDRVHRIGQFRPVKITRFCIEDSIESRIIELQEKKANMIHATINQDDSAMNRLTSADLQFLFNN